MPRPPMETSQQGCAHVAAGRDLFRFPAD